MFQMNSVHVFKEFLHKTVFAKNKQNKESAAMKLSET